MLKRLYIQIYLAIVVSLLVVLTVAGLFWRFSAVPPIDEAFEVAGELATGAVAPPEFGLPAQQEAVERLAARLRTDVALFDPFGRLIAAAGRPVPPPEMRGGRGGWMNTPRGPAWALRLADDRWLVARLPGRRRHPALALVVFLGAITIIVAVAALPIARRITRRLERLQTGVEQLGAGDLSARVKVEGRDEVARLAGSFNRAAARIEELVGAHKLLLANASHELRTPLTRIRLGVELMKGSADPVRKAEIERDIAELDGLVEEILLASRLDAQPGPDGRLEEVDLLALAAEECAHYPDCALEGKPATLRGEARLLRRLIRNLLENAQRHGRPPVEVGVAPGPAGVELTVRDHGPPIPESDRDRLFTPFARLAASGTGTGLGLALVRQIARRHGGEATYEVGGDGTGVFRIRLPK